MSYRIKIWIAALLSVIIIILLHFILPSSQRSFINSLSIIGFVISILGILIAYLQILSIKAITLQTNEQINNSINLNNKLLMISDLSRKSAMVDEIQGYLKSNKIEMCILRMKDLKVILNSLKNQDQYNSLVTKKRFNDIFQTFNIDLDNFQMNHLNENYRIDKQAILKNLEDLSSLFLSVEVKLKTPSHDQ